MTGRDLEQRRRVLRLLVMLTALGWRSPFGGEPATSTAVKSWLGGRPGLGRDAAGMAGQGYDLQLTSYGDGGWRATFYPAGRGPLVTYSGSEPTALVQ